MQTKKRLTPGLAPSNTRPKINDGYTKTQVQESLHVPSFQSNDDPMPGILKVVDFPSHGED